MKKFKKSLAIALAMILLINPTITAHAMSDNQVTVSFGGTYASYKAFDSESSAAQHPITLYVKPEDFPVRATIYSAAGSSEEYIIEGYGTVQLKVDNVSWGDITFSLLTFMLGSIFLLDDYVYATIVVAEPPKASPQNSSSSGNKSSDSVPEKASQLQPLVDKLDFTSDWLNEYIQEDCLKDLEDFMSGKWDGSMKSHDDYCVFTNSDIVFRYYRWSGTNGFSLKPYNEINVNIDYIGKLDITTCNLFTLAIDYSKGRIEKWEFLEMTDSWVIPVENESIESVFSSSNPAEDGCQANVFTIDEEGNTHLYLLLPNKEVLKAN